MGASKSLRGCFSHNMDPVLHFLVFNQECLDIGESLSINWTTPCYMVLVSSCCLLSLEHFLHKTLDSFYFLELTHSFGLLSLSIWGFRICSLIMLIFLHSSRVMGLVLHSLVDLPIYIFNSIFSLQKGERHVFTFTPFFRGSPLSPYHFSLLSLGWKWIRDILL